MSKFEKGHKPWNTGKKRSDETKEKISKSLTGKKHSKETIEKRKISAKKVGVGKWMKYKTGKDSPVFGKHWKIKDTSRMNKDRHGKKRKPFTEEWKKNISIATREAMKKPGVIEKMSGENSYNWKGGISKSPYSVDWTETLRRSIRERDNYICQMPGCGNLQGDRAFSVHHIDYNKKNCNPDNLVTLCPKCHQKTNFNRDYWIEYFKKIYEEKNVKS